MSDPYIHEVMKHRAVQRLDVCGQPDEAVVEGLPASSADVAVSITPGMKGFIP